MNNVLVAYFSATGFTAAAARKLAQAASGALYEIRPAIPYTAADLDWRNRQSRSTVEMKDPDCRPALMDSAAPVEKARTVFVGFPIWWYREPSIIDSFLAAYDFSGKHIIPFATSGGSGLGKEAPQRMQAICPGAKVLPGRLLSGSEPPDVLKAWAESVASDATK